MALGALPLRDEVEHVHLQKKQSERVCRLICARMQPHEMDKKAAQERMRMLKQARTHSRAEKYAGRAGPPDVQEPAEAVLQPEAAGEAASEAGWSVVCKRGSDASHAEWDMVGRDEHLHSPQSCRPPCTARTRALCTVS